MSETQLTLERVIPAVPERLFALWTDPRQLVSWWAPDGFECSIDCLEARPGGRWRTVMQKSGAPPMAISGQYRIVERPRQLTFTWAWELPDGKRGHETEVSVTFQAVPGGTRLILVQQEFESTGARDRHSGGWAGCFDRLTALSAAA